MRSSWTRRSTSACTRPEPPGLELRWPRWRGCLTPIDPWSIVAAGQSCTRAHGTGLHRARRRGSSLGALREDRPPPDLRRSEELDREPAMRHRRRHHHELVHEPRREQYGPRPRTPRATGTPSDARRLRFAAAWHRPASPAPPPSVAAPAYAAPIAAPGPPADALVVTPQSLDVADTASDSSPSPRMGGGCTSSTMAFSGGRRTAAEIVDADVAPGPSPRRLWVRPRQRDVVDGCGRVPLHRLTARDAGAPSHPGKSAATNRDTSAH